MKIFISWSGTRSRGAGELLSSLIEKTYPSIAPWISTRNIEPGVDWNRDLHAELRGAEFGIICVTPDNKGSVWLNFEAGALSNIVAEKSRVVPYLIGFKSIDLQGPLAAYQAVLADKEGTARVLRRIADMGGMAESELASAAREFNKAWPKFEASLREVLRPPVYMKVDESHLVATEANSTRVRAYNLSFDPETGPFDRSSGEFNESLAYMIDVVAENLKRGRPYDYILAPKPWKNYSDWVDETLVQIRKLDRKLRDRGAGPNLNLLKFTLLHSPAPADYSIDILSTFDNGGETLIGYWFLEGPGPVVPNQYALEVRDEEALIEQWNLLEELASAYGLRYALDNALGHLDEIGEHLKSRWTDDPGGSYRSHADKIKAFMWDRMHS